MDMKSYLRIRNKLSFKPKPSKLFFHLFIDLALAALIYQTQSGPYYILSQLLVPIFMFRMFALMHDCLHGSTSKSRWLNTFVGIISGAACLLPYEPWKKIHLEHHMWAGNVDKDPSMGLVKNFAKNKVKFNK